MLANLPPEADLLLVSAAVGQDNPEVASARSRGVPVLKYAQFLGRLMEERQGIAVAGTHGKTTTTAMVAWTLAHAGRDPSCLLGGEYPGIGGRAGSGDHLVAEACEFDRSFLNLHPTHAIVTNIEEDHLDYFRSIDEIREAFAEFVRLLPAHGSLVINGDDPPSAHLAAASAARVHRFSVRGRDADWWVEDVEPEGGGVRFTARSAAGESAGIHLRVPGLHNVKNALATTALLRGIGLSLEETAAGLGAFAGVGRRFEVLRREPVVVIDDYGHHPTEVEAVLCAARETYPGRRVVLVFQPHQYSRTRLFLGRFADVLARADEAVIAEVYRARDSNEDVARVNSSALVEAVRARGGRATGGPSFGAILEHLRSMIRAGDVVICLGAGDITLLTRRIADELWPPEADGGAGVAAVLREAVHAGAAVEGRVA